MNRKSIVFAQPQRVAFMSTPMPAMDADSVLVKTTVTSISRGTELNLYNGRTRAIRGRWYAWYPLVPGYEAVGRVLEVGKNVTHVTPGDRVVGSNVVGGFAGLCSAWGGQTEYGAYTNATAPGSAGNTAVKVPDEVSDEEALMVVLAAVPLNGMRVKLPFLAPGMTVLVTGLGAMGLATCQFLNHLGVRVIAGDPNEHRTQVAGQAGWADVVCARDEALQKAVADMTDGGPDVVIDTSGSLECLSQGLEIVRHRGTVLGMGLYLQSMMLDLCNTLWSKSITFACCTGESPELRAEILDMIADGRFDARSMISATFDVEQAAEVYRRVNDEPHKIIKPIIRWAED